MPLLREGAPCSGSDRVGFGLPRRGQDHVNVRIAVLANDPLPNANPSLSTHHLFVKSRLVPPPDENRRSRKGQIPDRHTRMTRRAISPLGRDPNLPHLERVPKRVASSLSTIKQASTGVDRITVFDAEAIKDGPR